LPITSRMQSGQLRHCDFCDEFSGGLENSFAARYQNTAPSRVILSTANFRVIPSLGQIIEGYLLIVPVSHYTAVSDMPTELTGELSELCSYVRTVLVKVYGPCVFFLSTACVDQKQAGVELTMRTCMLYLPRPPASQLSTLRRIMH